MACLKLVTVLELQTSNTPSHYAILKRVLNHLKTDRVKLKQAQPSKGFNPHSCEGVMNRAIVEVELSFVSIRTPVKE